MSNSSINSYNDHAVNGVKKGEALVAQDHQVRYVAREHSQVREKVQVYKDVIVPSQVAFDVEKKGTMQGKTPILPPTDDNPFGEGGANEIGLISIIGTVMALQAKTNSNFWNTLWKQASQSMMMQVKFAPIIGEAIAKAYDAQAAATTQQAAKSRTDGLSNLLGTFGGSLVMGGIFQYKELSEAAGALETVETTAPTVAKDVVKPAVLDGEEAVNPLVTKEEIAETVNGNGESLMDGLMRRWDSLDLKKGIKILGDGLKKGMESAMLAGAAGQGMSGLLGSQYETEMAKQQRLEGQDQATSKEAEQYSQFYNQAFSRSEDLRQGGQQNIDYAMNILKSAADTITQTVTSMFRG